MDEFVVDAFGKVTVSLGGRCPLACRHCYTTVSSFQYAPPRSAEDVVERLHALTTPFSTICVSGDTDCFLDEEQGLWLISELVERFSSCDVLFTTRLVPGDRVVEALLRLGRRMSERGRLLVAGVSLASMQVPNPAERSRLIPPTERRLALLRQFTDDGIACIAALRPTFPFRVIPPDEVEAVIRSVMGRAAVVLGEVFILDEPGTVATRLGMDVEAHGDRRSGLAFLPQPGLWRKRTLSAEVRFVAGLCGDLRIPFFMRSGTALRWLRANWDYSAGRMVRDASSPLHNHFAEADP